MLLHHEIAPIQLVCSPLEPFDILYSSAFFFAIIAFFLISAHYTSFRIYGVNKLQDALLLFSLQVFFAMYTGYRCYYHIYLDGNIFYIILTIKLCYVCYRNSTSLFEYTATKGNAKKKEEKESLEEKEGMEERTKIQNILMHFNSQVGFVYLQLVIMQIYFVSTVLFNSYHNCTLLAFQNSMFIQELVFLALTICLTLVMQIFSTVWSFDLLKVNKTLFGGLLISLGVLPIVYFIALLFAAMHFDAYPVLIGLLIVFTFLYSDLVVAHRLVFERNSGNFFKPYSAFVSYIQGVFVYFSFIIVVWLSNYLMPAFLSYLTRFSAYPMDMGELSVELANLEYLQSASYLDFASNFYVLLFMLGLAFIVGLFLGIRAYVAFLSAYISEAYPTERVILYYMICLFFYLVSRFIAN